MKSVPTPSVSAAVLLFVSCPLALAQDLRFDVSTSNNGVLLPNLAFPSANGHVGLLGGSTYQSTLTSKGNTLGIYFNNFNSGTPFSSYPDPHDMAESIQSYANEYWTTPGSNSGWIALNEISSANWQSDPINSLGYDYHSWVIDVVALLKNGDNSDPSNIIPAHTGVIIWAPFGAPSSANKSSWQALAQNAYIADERYINATTVQADNYSVATVQNFYQTSFNAWINAGVPANRLMLSEEYTNSTAGNGYGANGLSGEAWQAAIEVRNLAAYNVGFAGYVGYAWGKNAQGSSNSALISYENAYASTMVVQTEVPCWTGNDGSSSWNDYLNWTGGLPSTTQFPYDSMLNNSYNVGVIQHQTAANFLSNANPSATGTTITLDGNQSITTMTFDSPHSYTIAPGSGGSLTLTGTNSSITVNQGSHSITAGLQLASNVSANLTGNLLLSGNFSTSGHTLTKTGTGTLTISGTQTHVTGSAISVTAGTLNLNSDAGSNNSRNLALSATGGNISFGSPQHLASLSLTNATAAVQTNQQYLLTNSLALSASTLDLSSNDLIVDSSNSSTTANVISYLTSGYNHGSWNGPGINSSAAANDTTHATTLAYAIASNLLGPTGGTFDGQSVNPKAILVKYTHYGDNDLDGKVTLNDFSIFVDGFNGLGSGWVYGDYDYNGVIDMKDFSTFVEAYKSQGAQLSSLNDTILSDASLSVAQKNAMLSVVPEPGSFAIYSITAAPILTRRKRRV